MQMVILDSRRMIYIHIHKTGGDTVEHTLAQIEQPDDVILDAEHPDASKGYEQRFGLGKHSTALEVVRVLGPETWRSYFSWATVRNPYARIASFYSYLAAITEPELSLVGYPLEAPPEVQRRWVDSPDYSMTDQWAFAGVRAYLATRASRTPFSDFLRYPLLATDEPAYLSQFSRVRNADSDALLIYRAVKLESLTGLWPQLCRDMGLPRVRLRSTNRTPHRWRRSVADLFVRRADVELINSIHADDFCWFGYEMMGRDPAPRIYPGAAG
jgi:hypothetical protein